MATFEQNENLHETGFVSFVAIVSGGGQVWRYCGSDAPLVDADGNTYQPVPLMTDNIQADGSLNGQELTVKMPRGITLADRFFPEADPSIYSIIIRQAHHAEGVIHDAPLVFTGVITSVSSSGDNTEMRLKCTTQQGLLSRSGLRRRYQHQCPFVLYGPECRASKIAASFQVNIEAPSTTAFGDIVIRIYGEDADNPGIWRGRDMSVRNNRMFLVGATLTFGGADYRVWGLGDHHSDPTYIRLVMNSNERDALRAAISAATPESRLATITPSCDHTVTCCQQVFSNGKNFGGMPWIPFENPVKQMFIGGGA